MESMTLKAAPRQTVGTRVTRRLRESGMLPAIIYGHGEPPMAITLSNRDVEFALDHHQRSLKVEIEGETKQYLIKEVQYDHLGQSPIHLDLARVDMHELVQVVVGIELRGIPKGVAEGGVLDQNLAEIEVECVMTDIPDTLRPLVTHLGLEEFLSVKDLEVPPGVKVLTPGDERVCTVRPLVEEPEVEAEAGEGEEGTAEPEVISRGKKEQEEETED
jgi:large subunit ribosomal protein L25